MKKQYLINCKQCGNIILFKFYSSYYRSKNSSGRCKSCSAKIRWSKNKE